MALGFPPSGKSAFIPSIKYSARDGRIIRLDDVRENEAYVSRPTDITDSFEAVFDLDNIEVGYAMFQKGAAPDFRLVRHGNSFPPRPSDKHDLCVRFILRLAKDCAGDTTPIRECISTAGVFRRAIDALHDSFIAQKPTNPDKLPNVKLKGTVPVPGGHGANQFTNHQPVFEIIGWTARPDDLRFVEKGTSGL